MKKQCFISICLLLIYILSSCKGMIPREQHDNAPVLYSTEHIYTEIPLAWPEILTDPLGWEDIYACADGIFCKGYTDDPDSADGNRCIIGQYDWDGNWLGHRMAPPEETDYSLLYTKDEYWTSDGGVVYLYYDRDNTEACFLIRLDNAGTVLYRTELPVSGGLYGKILVCSEKADRIALLADMQIYLFDFTLSLLHTYPLSVEPDSLYWGSDGNLYLQDFSGALERLDTATGRREPCLDGYDGREPPKQYYGGGYDLYICRDDGLYGLTAGTDGIAADDANGTLLIDWASSSLTPSKTNILYIRDAETILAYSSNNLEGKEQYVLLKPAGVDAEEKPVNTAREEVEILLRGITPDIETLAAEFNRQSGQYTVKLTENEALNTRLDAMELQQFMSGMQKDGFPDLLLFDSYHEPLYDMLTEQGYLAELTHLTEGMTGSVKSAVVENGVSYRIPLYVWYDTMTCLIEACDGDLTLEQILRSAETLEQGETLFSSTRIYHLLFTCIQTLFMDEQTGSCRFDSEEFRQYMELLAHFASTSSEDLGYLYSDVYQGMTWLDMTSPDLPLHLQDGKIRYLHLPLYRICDFGVTELLYGEKEYTICGFPGVMALPSFAMNFAVMKNGDCPDGALAFLEFILSDEVQSSSVIRNQALPVTSSAMDILLEDTYYYYTISDGAMRTRFHITCTGNTMLDEIHSTLYDGMFLYTEEDKAAIRAFTEDPSHGNIADGIIEEILREEFAPYLAGDRSADDTVRILQSRVSTYLAE